MAGRTQLSDELLQKITYVGSLTPEEDEQLESEMEEIRETWRKAKLYHDSLRVTGGAGPPQVGGIREIPVRPQRRTKEKNRWDG